LKSRINKTGGNRPEILAPVNALSEVEPLLDAGAHWLYGGVIPAEWAGRFPTTVLLNQRTFAGAQFATLADLQEAVTQTRDRGGAFALTLNAPFYMDEQMSLALELGRLAADTGVSALIVADPGLIIRIRDEGIDLPLHLSTMGIAANHRSVKLFADLGVTRVILPRFLTLDQIFTLAKSAPYVDYEAFILVGKCPHIEGVCTFVHDSQDQRWPCEWEWDLEDGSRGALPVNISKHFAGIRESDRRDGCGLCALPALKASGVSTFKIVGRGAPLKRKLQLVQQLGLLMKKMPEQSDKTWIERCMTSYKEIYGHPCCEHNCYYPDAIPYARTARS
jgi:putative protease